METITVARGLGWFSIALGLTEMLAPNALARFLGLRPSKRLIRLYGAREFAVGVAILSRPALSRWFWARAAGDVLDLATLGVAAKNNRRLKRAKMAFSVANVAAIGALDAYVAKRLAA